MLNFLLCFLPLLTVQAMSMCHRSTLRSIGAALLVFAGFTPALLAQLNTETLTNAAVVQMVNGKLAKSLVIAKINNTRPGFDLSANGLVSLTENHISQEVVKVMIAAAESAKSRGDGQSGVVGLDEVLTNDHIVHMVVGKVPKDLIFGKIRTSRSAFDVSAGGLVKLNTNKVPQDVIKAMLMPVEIAAEPVAIAVRPAPTAAAAVSPASSASPAASVSPKVQAAPATVAAVRATKSAVPIAGIPKEAGLYLYETDAAGNRFTALEVNNYDASKTGGSIGSAITGGIAKKKIIAVVMDPEASIATTDANVEFYFVFDAPQKAPAGMRGLYVEPTSPNEFGLVRMNAKSDSRELVVGSLNARGAASGTETKANVSFKFTRLKTGVYRVIPTKPLTPGQYAFVPPPMMPGVEGMGAAGSGKLYDFTVR